MDKKCDYCDELLTEWDFITNCGHVLCASCYRLDVGDCLLCKKHCEYKLIGEKMSTNGTKYLSPISRVLNDTQEIVEFQMSSLLRLVSFLRDKVERQRLLLQQVKQELSSVKDFKWELHHLREENELLKNKLNKQQQQPIHQKQQENDNKQDQENEEEADDGYEVEEEEEEEEDNEQDKVRREKESKGDGDSGLYYRPLKKDDFSNQQQLRLWKRPLAESLFFQSRANEINYQNLL